MPRTALVSNSHVRSCGWVLQSTSIPQCQLKHKQMNQVLINSYFLPLRYVVSPLPKEDQKLRTRFCNTHAHRYFIKWRLLCRKRGRNDLGILCCEDRDPVCGWWCDSPVKVKSCGHDRFSRQMPHTRDLQPGAQPGLWAGENIPSPASEQVRIFPARPLSRWEYSQRGFWAGENIPRLASEQVRIFPERLLSRW